MAQLELRNINKLYPNGTKASDDVSFTAEQGEFVVLVGPSGCGKSTILRMIAGLEDVSSGEIFFDGKRIDTLAPKKRDVGMVFQNYALYPHLTVYENLAFPLNIRRMNKTEIKKAVEETAEILSISSLLPKKPKEISGGEKQRVALGRAIVRKPKLFLFDEPLSNLDAKLRVQMRTEIMNLQRRLGVTSVYVTHDQTEAMTMGSRIVVLKSGTVQQIASPEEIYMYPSNSFVASFIGSPQMNFFSGSISRDGGLQFATENKELKFALESNDIINYIAKEIKQFTIGIRPEKVKVGREPYAHSNFLSEIENIEYLGYETLVFFRIGDSLKCARCDSRNDFELKEKLYFSFEQNDMLFYDKDGLLINTKHETYDENTK